MIYFKYMKSARSFFEDGYIRLTQRSALNDPFEAMYCSQSLNELARHFDDQTVFDGDGEELSFHDYVEKNINSVGVISLSESKDNLLMWAHYANEHKGIIAGINDFGGPNIFRRLFIPNMIKTDPMCEQTPFNGDIKPVIYRKSLRYKTDKFDFDYSNIFLEGGDRILNEIYLQKSDEWIYEKEKRIILRLEQADRAIIHNLDSLENEKIKNHVKISEWSRYDKNEETYEIRLNEIDDNAVRYTIANHLASLSKNSKNIYLMQLHSGAISHCIFGINSHFEPSSISTNYAKSTGNFEFWKAKKNESYYCIDLYELNV